MSFVTTQPEMLASTAGSLQAIGSAMAANNSAAAGPTTGVIPAAADEVSTGIAQLFSQHAASYQAMAAQAAAFNGQFVQHLTAGAFSYADIEAAITVFLLRPLEDFVFLLPMLAEQFFISTSGNTSLGLELSILRSRPTYLLLLP